MSISRTRAYTARDEAREFARRCENALSFANQYGEPAWKVEALEEALSDALDAVDDWSGRLRRTSWGR